MRNGWFGSVSEAGNHTTSHESRASLAGLAMQRAWTAFHYFNKKTFPDELRLELKQNCADKR